jgi:hypothetical protein
VNLNKNYGLWVMMIDVLLECPVENGEAVPVDGDT